MYNAISNLSEAITIETPTVEVKAAQVVVEAVEVTLEADPLDELIEAIKVNNIPSNINNNIPIAKIADNY